MSTAFARVTMILENVRESKDGVTATNGMQPADKRL
jgi:hypothetical protein